MERFSSFITETSYRKRKDITKLYDGPMFSVYYSNDLPVEIKHKLLRNIPFIESHFTAARNTITKFGFRKMKASVVIKDLSKMNNHVTGKEMGGVAGYASNRIIGLDINTLLRSGHKQIKKIIIHEWGHLWMARNSKAFKNAVRKLYYDMLGGDYLDTDSLNDEKARELYGHQDHDKQHGIENFVNKKIAKSKFDIATFLRNVYHNNKYSEEQHDERYKQWLMGEGDYPEETYGEFYAPSYEDFAYSVGDSIYKNFIKGEVEHPDNYRKVTLSFAKKRLYPMFKKFILYMEDSVKFIENEMEEKRELDNVVASLDDKLYDFNERLFHFLTKVYRHADTDIDGSTHGKEAEKLRNQLADILTWIDSYGMGNEKELWATAIEHLNELPREYRQKILSMIG